MITLGLIQAPSTLDLDENIDTIRHFIIEAKRQDCRALCFPEAFLTGYVPGKAPADDSSRKAQSGFSTEADNSSTKALSNLAITVDDPAIKTVSALAIENDMDLLAGFMEKSGDQFFLTHGIFTADGRREFYRKTHLGQKEQMIFTPGDKLEVFHLSCNLTIGIQLCVETHFPEITQTLSLMGAEVIFAPHAVPRAAGDRHKIWSRFIPARSYDNRVYMACCNQWDISRFGGGCMVTDPRGELIAACQDDGPSLLTFQTDPEEVRRYHQENSRMSCRYYPARRRPELYRTDHTFS